MGRLMPILSTGYRGGLNLVLRIKPCLWQCSVIDVVLALNAGIETRANSLDTRDYRTK